MREGDKVGNTVEGWSNYETWNVNLWFDNEYDLYTAKVAFLRNVKAVNAANVKRLVLSRLPNGTKDMQGRKDYDKVNWPEIAESWAGDKAELSA